MTGFCFSNAHGTNKNRVPAERAAKTTMNGDPNQSSYWPLSTTTSSAPRNVATSTKPTKSNPGPPPPARTDPILSLFGLFQDKHIDQHKQNRADRTVDQKAPMPGVVVADIAAEHRPHDGCYDDGDSIKCECLLSFGNSSPEGGFEDERLDAAEAIEPHLSLKTPIDPVRSHSRTPRRTSDSPSLILEEINDREFAKLFGTRSRLCLQRPSDQGRL